MGSREMSRRTAGAAAQAPLFLIGREHYRYLLPLRYSYPYVYMREGNAGGVVQCISSLNLPDMRGEENRHD